VNNNDSFPLLFIPEQFGRLFTVFFLLTFTLIVVAGCDFRRVVVNQPVDPQTLETLSQGKSSMQDVVQTLGAPDAITAKPDGMIFQYRYGDTKTMRVNFGWILRFFFPVAPSMNLGRGEVVPEVLHIAMNQDGVFDRYLLQQPPNPPHFSFWPF
jgi:hypothetical protein